MGPHASSLEWLKCQGVGSRQWAAVSIDWRGPVALCSARAPVIPGQCGPAKDTGNYHVLTLGPGDAWGNKGRPWAGPTCPLVQEDQRALFGYDLICIYKQTYKPMCP